MDRDMLDGLYNRDGLSMAEIAKLQNCSLHRVAYWLHKYGIPRRSKSEAIYKKNHPKGDPFAIKPIRTKNDAWLQGLGLGLYWGEGNKANKWSIRLGNTDPALIRCFMQFLTHNLGVKQSSLRFSLQLFSDVDVDEALKYWTKELNVSLSQFGRPTVTISGSIGTYRRKCRYGVVTVAYHNKKLKDMLVAMLPR